jgi:hypothetical protein
MTDTTHHLITHFHSHSQSTTMTTSSTQVTHDFLFAGLGAPRSSLSDKASAQLSDIALTFGEVSWDGVCKMMDATHLDAAHASVVFDLGSGCGRLLLQTYLMFPNIQRAVGVEYSSRRAEVGFAALRTYQQHYLEGESEIFEYFDAPRSVTARQAVARPYTLRSRPRKRNIELRHGDLFNATDACEADIVVLEVQIPVARRPQLLRFLSTFKIGCRLLTYHNLQLVYHREQKFCPWREIAAHDSQYECSWNDSCRLWCWEKVAVKQEEEDEEKA